MPLSHDPLWPRAGRWPAFGGDADAVLLGVPTWRTSLSPTGAHATPHAVRDALQKYSATLMGPSPVDLDAVLRIRDAGDVDEPDRDEAAVIARVRGLAPAFVIALGGDNSLTYPVALGAAASGLITFDAHFDLRDGISNGSPVRRLIEDDPAGTTTPPTPPTERIDPQRIVQIGIADFANSAAYARRAANWGIRVITLDEVRRRGIADVTAEALEIAGASGGRVHLDIDVDVCDRSVAPGCPASVPGGLAAWELRALARAVASDSHVVSADIAEVDATADAEDGRTVRLAALCVLELLAGLAARTS
jgi:formiminoglutamase